MGFFKVKYENVLGNIEEVELHEKWMPMVEKVMLKKANQCAGIPCARCPFNRAGYECPSKKGRMSINGVQMSTPPLEEALGEADLSVEVEKLRTEIRVLRDRVGHITEKLKSVLEGGGEDEGTKFV